MTRRSHGRDWLGTLFAALLVLGVSALVLSSLAIRAYAPCSWFDLVPAKDTPARCLMEH